MERASMATKKQQKQASGDGKAERLRALRLAHEATRREAGIWGEMTVGEILHQASRSVFMQVWKGQRRSEEHTSELQSLMRISYAVFCLKKKKYKKTCTPNKHTDTEQSHT